MKKRFLIVTAFCLIAALAFAGKKGDINEDLMKAIGKGDLALVKELIGKGADVNFKSGKLSLTPLMKAVSKRDQADLVNYLISAKADIAAKDSVNSTAVNYAAVWNQVYALEILQKAGADLNNTTTSGVTPLMQACIMKGKAAVEFLVKAGADVNAKDKKGETALDKAKKNKDIIDILTKAGAK